MSTSSLTSFIKIHQAVWRRSRKCESLRTTEGRTVCYDNKESVRFMNGPFQLYNAIYLSPDIRLFRNSTFIILIKNERFQNVPFHLH